MEGDPVDLLGAALYEAEPRWQRTREWRYQRGHYAIHASAAIGYVPQLAVWFSEFRGKAWRWSTEAAALADAERRMMAWHDEVSQSEQLYDERGPLWEER